LNQVNEADKLLSGKAITADKGEAAIVSEAE